MTEKRPPSVAELLREVGSPSGEPTSENKSSSFAEAERFQVKVQKQEEAAALDRQMGYAKLKAFQAHHDNKGRWSVFIMVAMGAMIFYQSVLLGLVGAKVWDFTAYEWLLPSLLVQNLAQIITLAAIIVKALFDKHKD